MAQLNRYKVLKKGTQFGKEKAVDMTATQAAAFVRAGELELLEEGVTPAGGPAKPGPDAAALKDEVAALKAQVETLNTAQAGLADQVEQLETDNVSLEMVIARIEADHPDAVAAAKEAVAAELAAGADGKKS